MNLAPLSTNVVASELRRGWSNRYGSAHGPLSLPWGEDGPAGTSVRFRWSTTILNAILRSRNEYWSCEVEDDDRYDMTLLLSDGDRVQDYAVRVTRKLLTLTDEATGRRLVTARTNGPGRDVVMKLAGLVADFFSVPNEGGLVARSFS